MANILASGIAQAEHLKAFDEMVEARFSTIDVEAVLIYMIDTVNVNALPILAEQFDVLGYKGYGLAQTELEKREVIKKAIELHRYKGTPWSIKEALKAIGYYGASIEEGATPVINYDGDHNHNGSQLYGPGHWADFSVTIDIGSTQGIDATTAFGAVALINEYKNVRSRLRYVSYKATLKEYVVDLTEELVINVEQAMSDDVGYYYNNHYIYNGNITHGNISEDLGTTIGH